MIVANGATGEGIAGQLQLTRLGPGGGGNTLRNVAAQTDASGNVYELQEAAYCIPNMGNLTVNGVKTSACKRVHGCLPRNVTLLRQCSDCSRTC